MVNKEKIALGILLVLLTIGCTGSEEENNEDPSLIQAQDGRYYLAFFSNRSGNADIWIQHSENLQDWSEPVQAVSKESNDFYPSLVQNTDGRFHLTWFATDNPDWSPKIWYSNSIDAVTWSEPKKITQIKGVDWAPNLAADDSGTLWITWSSMRTNNKDIFATTSQDNGETWNEPFQLTDHADGDDTPHLIQKKDGTYAMTWMRFEQTDILNWVSANPSSKIMYAESEDGINWNEAKEVSAPDPDNTVDALYPRVYSNTDETEYFIAWTSAVADDVGNIRMRAVADLENKTPEITTLPITGFFAKVIATEQQNQYAAAWIGAGKSATTYDVHYQLFER